MKVKNSLNKISRGCESNYKLHVQREKSGIPATKLPRVNRFKHPLGEKHDVPESNIFSTNVQKK